MRHKAIFLVFLLAAGFSKQVLADISYNGTWTYRALNAGDTSFRVEHKENDLRFYRELHPEFEGQTYKLEHLYHGTRHKNAIRGKLFVREEGMAEFEFLRPFSGTIESDDKILLDEISLKRETTIASSQTEDAPPEKTYSKVVINRKADPDPSQAEKVQVVGKTEKEPETTLPEERQAKQHRSKTLLTIPDLLPVAMAHTQSELIVVSHVRTGDQLFEQKKYMAALEKFETALRLDPNKLEVLYKLGLVHGILGSQALQSGKKTQGRKHLEKAIGFWTRVARYDPYNLGARENIRRAQAKLEK